MKIGQRDSPQRVPENAERCMKKTVIGWSEFVTFPDWHIHDLKAKVDTGARTSALHVEELESVGDGEVEFYVVLKKTGAKRRKKVRAKVVKWAKVRSSTGDYRKRCFVKTRIKVGPVEKDIEVSLVCREKMVFRMLLGRKALERDFLVDVSCRHQLGWPDKPKKEKHGHGH